MTLSHVSSRVLDARFPGIRELGVDIAVDQKGKLWILEVNTSPACSTFRLLRDKTMYRRIIKNKRVIYRGYR
ncbi:YheC/YheD family protein [Desmospora activa]|uniref:YheC/YheD family protein n=1 Tax=Desmospora activa TaxID=500615 RepID=UPI000D322A15|nr:YheC/YheD family protein [Desmospora activa]